MMKLAIDGSKYNGMYRVDCECGDNWSGTGTTEIGGGFSPALPIAECVAHMKLVHPDAQSPDIRFSTRFEGWLEYYWQRVSYVQSVHGAL